MIPKMTPQFELWELRIIGFVQVYRVHRDSSRIRKLLLRLLYGWMHMDAASSILPSIYFIRLSSKEPKGRFACEQKLR